MSQSQTWAGTCTKCRQRVPHGEVCDCYEDEVEDVCEACGEPGYCSCCAADDRRKRRMEEGSA